jgi:NADPH-dependent ferric siderophore reductase
VPAPPDGTPRARRAPPPFRRVTVRRVERLGPRMARVTVAGPDLAGFAVEEPAASIRLLLPGPGADLVVPEWNGNEFLLPDGRRPVIRTLTPWHGLPAALELDVGVALHGPGALTAWAETAEPGAPAAVSGPGRGYTIDEAAPAFLLAGDETAIPAVSQLLGRLPAATPTRVLLEVARPDGRLALPDHPAATVEWCDLPPGRPPGDALVEAVTTADVGVGTRVWAAGEAAAVQRIRRHIFEQRGLPRASTSVRGYWKHGRAGGPEDP